MPRKTRISPRRWLLLPIETKARELLGKMLLGCYAAERGWGVVLGVKEVVRNQQPLLPKGVILEKDADPTHEALVGVARSNGNRLSAMDEEGLLAFSGDMYLQTRISRMYLDELDYFFAWGDVQANWVESAGAGKGKIVRSGNPRFDMLRPEFRSFFDIEASRLRSEYGRIILFNTNFGLANPNASRDPMAFLLSSGKLKDRESEEFYKTAGEFEKETLREFLELIPLVANRYRDHTVVVRPHPSEGHEPWDELARDHENVVVCYEGSAQEWISAADVMVHSNCTTGLEAFLMGKPAICYRQRSDERFDYPLTNNVSARATSPDVLVALMDRVVDGGSIEDEVGEEAAIVDDYVSGRHGSLAIEEIMSRLETLDVANEDAAFPIRLAGPSLARRIVYKAGQGARRLMGNRGGGEASNLRYVKKKFSGMDSNELEEIIRRFDRTTGRFGAVQVTKICTNTFALHAG